MKGSHKSGRLFLRFLLLAGGAVMLPAHSCKDNVGKNITGPVTFRLSVGLEALQGNGSSSAPSVTADGRFVAFASLANNLASPSSSFKDIFIKDRLTGQVQNVSQIASISDPARRADCDNPFLSPDGRYIVYESSAVYSDFFGNPLFLPQTKKNLWFKDLQGQFALNLLPKPVVQPWPDQDCVSPSVAINGASVWVVFATRASAIGTFTNPVSGTPPMSSSQVYSIDMNSGLVPNPYFLVSHASIGVAIIPDGDSLTPMITGDGKGVAFTSGSSNVIAGGPAQGLQLVYLGPPNTGTGPNILVSSPAGAATITGTDGMTINGYCLNPAVSADGNLVAFTTLSTNLVPGGMIQDLIIRDIAQQTTTRVASNVYALVHVSKIGQPIPGTGFQIGLSDDGRSVAYTSNLDLQVYLTDTISGTALLSVNLAGGAGNQGSTGPVLMTPDGQWVFWSSAADNLVLNDTNQATDVFGNGPRR